MRHHNMVRQTICVAVILTLPTTLLTAQSTRLVKPEKESETSLNPLSIESETIDSKTIAPSTSATAKKQSLQPIQKPFNPLPQGQFTPLSSAKQPNGALPKTPRVEQISKPAANAPASTNNTRNQGATSRKGIFGFRKQTTPTPAPKRPSSQLELKSTPTIQTKISAPRTIILNQPARFQIQAANVGTTDVNQVKLVAILPEHGEFVASTPKPSNINGKRYEFILNGLAARSNQVVQLDVSPTKKLPLNIDTQIQIESQQQLAVTVQQPVLEITVDSPTTIQTGKTVEHHITVTNTGDGIAKAVRLETKRPDGLEVGKSQKNGVVPKLNPGQSTKFVLSSFAVSEGQSEIMFQVSARGAETRQARSAVNIIRPELNVQVFGPGQNYMGHDGIYTIQLQNVSETPITKVAVELDVPTGLFVDTISQKAKIDKSNRSFSWIFDSIPGKQQQVIQFRAKSTAIGSQVCRVNVQTGETASRQMELETQVLGRADLSIRVTDSGTPVSIGNQSDITIDVANHGSQNAREVAVTVELPGALRAVEGTGYSIDPSGNRIIFSDIDIAAGKYESLRFKVVAVTEGEHIVRGTVSLPGAAHSISSENSIFVFEAESAKVSDALVPVIRR